MARIYQYDSLTQPISTAKESVHVDGWMQPPTPPQRNWAVSAMAFAVVLASASGSARIDPKLLTQKETVHVEAWMQPATPPQANWTVKQLAFATVLARASGAVVDPKLLTLKEAVSFDKWAQNTNQPVLVPQRASLGWYVTDPKVASSELVTLDKWWQAASVPTLLPRSIAQTASSGHNEFPVVLYRFQPRSYYPDAVNGYYPRATYASSFTGPVAPVVIPEVITLNKWFQPASIPTRLPLASAVLYQTAIDANILTLKESVSIDRWGQPTNQPVRLLQRTSLGWYATDPKVVAVAEVVTIDKWFQPTSVPVRLLRSVAQTASSGHQEFPVVQYHFQPRSYYPDYIPRTFPSSVYLVSSHLEGFHQSHGAYTPFYAQYPSWISRIFPVAAYASSGAGPAKVFPVETITIDKWFQPASVPTRLAARSPVLYQAVIDPKLLTVKEAVTIDKFHPDYPSWINRLFPEATYYASGAVGVISTAAGVVVVINFVSPGMHNFISQEIGPGVEN